MHRGSETSLFLFRRVSGKMTPILYIYDLTISDTSLDYCDNYPKRRKDKAMTTEIINAPAGVKYMSDIEALNGDLPHNAVIDTTVTGCGAKIGRASCRERV